MKKKKTVVGIFLVGLALVGLVGCEQLASLQNPSSRISGGWQKIEMSFPGDEVYTFSERVISVNGIEEGTYRFEGSSQLEVALHGRSEVYEIEFVDDDSKMVWYRKTEKGRDRVSEWVRAQ